MSLMNCIKNNLKRHSLKRMHYLMGTFLSIEVFHCDEDRSKEVIEAAFNEVGRIEGLLSRFKEAAQVYKINNFAHIQPHVVDEELFCLIADCLEFSKLTNGAFDISVASLVDLWFQSQRKNSFPTQEEILSLIYHLGYRNIILDKERQTIFFKTPHLKLDFGAVGKGYALDRTVKILKENNIRKAKLDFGGHLYYFDNSELDAEYVGIRNPLSCEEIIFSIPLKNRSISTSANYERNFSIQGKRYGHLVNPLSGFPVDNHIASVSIISPSALEADILSTAFFVLGLDRGMQLIKNTNVAEVIIITDNHGRPQLYSSQSYEEVMCCS